MHDGVDGGGGEKLIEERSVSDVADDEAGRRGNGVAVAAGEVVEDSDVKIVLQEEADGGSANVARAAGDQDVLRHRGASVAEEGNGYGI
jgi:hypothetical protein